MDALTHLFLPLLVAYVVRPDLFSKPRYMALGGFGLLADFDKLLGVPGLLHSLVTLVPICLGLVAVERVIRKEIHYSRLASVFIMSHLVFDIIEGVTVPLLFPLVTTGIGLAYPMEVVFGTGTLGFTFQGWPVTLKIGVLRTGHAAADVATNTFGFINGFGVASLLAFLTAFVSQSYVSDNGESG
jgi:hypothetical protein